MSPNTLKDYEMKENAKGSSNCEATTGVARASMVANASCLLIVAASSEISPTVVHSPCALKVMYPEPGFQSGPGDSVDAD